MDGDGKATVKKTVVGEKTFFQLACADMARLTNVLLFDSADVLKPRVCQSWVANVWEQIRYFSKATYLTVFGGFVPYYFKLLRPLHFKFFQLWSVINTLWRKRVLSPLLRLMGYGKYCTWENEPAITKLSVEPGSASSRPYAGTRDIGCTSRLAKMELLDPDLSIFSQELARRGALISPHSHSNPNPLVAAKQIFFGQNFPGNFFDHLVGVWKALAAWHQPQYICRGGFFHSVYGTNQYRAGIWGYNERNDLRTLIGAPAEELAFLICTAERSDLCHDLCARMYTPGGKLPAGIKALAARKAFLDFYKDPSNRMDRVLGEEGLALTNHITGQQHIFAPRVVAAFTVVMMADFLEQGVSGISYYEEDDIMFFQFIKLRFWADVLVYLRPHLDCVPSAFEKYSLLQGRFDEPDRQEILTLKRVWHTHTVPVTAGRVDTPLNEQDQQLLLGLVHKCPWIPEPQIALAVSLSLQRVPSITTSFEAPTTLSAVSLANSSLEALQAWGMLHLKEAGHNRDAVAVAQWVLSRAKQQ
mmetsp:Transcript_15578/g.30582  ORF Transcript_15578/g.30582 Transcript_15578/m.30582 type:complete len:529 (-) Transcript_15578:151-1737(-)